jgi:LuxR family transcriptional regulator, quorum-sensing system regulator LasR
MTSIVDQGQYLDDILQLNDCKTHDEISATLRHLSRRLGFDAFLYGGRFNVGDTRPVEHVETNYSVAWRQRYIRSGYIQLDPTVSHAVGSLRPLVWSNDIYLTDAQRGFREEAAAYGLISGITFPVHSKDGDVALLSLSLSQSGTEARRHIQETQVWGPLIAMLAHDVMCGAVKRLHNTRQPTLTRRELEVLKWIAAGKSTWEISKLINISEHGVIYHVRNLLQKFDVTSRHQAVVKAMSFRLI